MSVNLSCRIAVALAMCGVVALEAAAAVGVPENIVLYRVDESAPIQANLFIQKRTNSSNFTPTADFSTQFVNAPAADPSDIIQWGDVNGDGLDDTLVVRDVRQFGFAWQTIAGVTIDTVGGLVFPGFLGAPNRTDGQTIPDAMDPTGLALVDNIFTRRDFDGDGRADTFSVLDGAFFPPDEFTPGPDVFQWLGHGSTNIVALDPAAPFYNSGQVIFGAPLAFDAQPLVGDFDGDGIADRAVSNSALLVSGGGVDGRQVQIDLSPAAATFGDGAPDNISEVFGSFESDEVQAADINGDGLDDLVVIRPVDLDDGMGGIIETYELEGYINSGVFDGTNPTFARDTNYDYFVGARNLGDTILFATLGLIEGVPGDYNDDGTVDAADYTVFRDNLGQNVTLPNENPAAATPGVVDLEDYTFWANNFGEPTAPASSASVPEPGALVLGLMAAGWLVRRR